MIWEVDPPGTAASAAEARWRRQRIQFFQRRGGTLLPRQYIQPPISGVPVPMQLMFRGAAALPMPDNIALRRIVEAMYFDKYGALNGIPADILRKLLWDDISYS